MSRRLEGRKDLLQLQVENQNQNQNDEREKLAKKRIQLDGKSLALSSRNVTKR
jgi:hypothetical protein